jgi:1,2-diacylglycerol 3-alpha-glucosyltransferase
MNILITTETYFPIVTGVSVSTFNIASYLAGRGHKVTLVCPKAVTKGETPSIPNCELVALPAYPILFFNIRPVAIFPLAILKMIKLFKTHKFDVVHIQEPAEGGIAALIVAKHYHVPIAGYLHTVPEQNDRLLFNTTERILTPFLNVYFKFIYSKYDVAITPSYFFKSYLKFLGIKTPIETVSNGVEVKRFAPRKQNPAFRKKYDIPEKSILFMYLGRLDGDKNVETLIKAMPYTNDLGHLLVIGRGRFKERLHGLAKRIKAENKITWIDYISDKEMANAYNASDAFTIMSPYEGQSIVTLLACASGLPVIAASAGALPEICRDNENGFLVHTYDYKTLAEKMNQLADNKELREKFGAESRRISLLHARPKNFQKLEEIYKKLTHIK